MTAHVGHPTLRLIRYSMGDYTLNGHGRNVDSGAADRTGERQMKRLLIAFALLTPLSRYAASFDCQKAQAADEKAICAHLTLANDKDVEMHANIGFWGCSRWAVAALQDAQQSWQRRRQCKADVTCLTKALGERHQSSLTRSVTYIDKPLLIRMPMFKPHVTVACIVHAEDK